jgi:hypothetical protein
MHEPTDRELKIQGLTRQEYNSMSLEGKELISQRSPRLRSIENIILGAQLLNAMLDADESLGEKVKNAIEGSDTEFQTHIREIVQEYLNSQVDASIAEYYRIKYSGKEQKTSPLEKPEDISVAENEQTANDEKARGDNGRKPIEEPSFFETEKAASKPIIQNKKNDEKTQKATIPQSQEERKANIALIFSQNQGKNPDYYLRAEHDIIAKIMTVTDEQKHTGVTDEKVITAIQQMIEDDKNIQFPMEALLPDKREELLKKTRQ